MPGSRVCASPGGGGGGVEYGGAGESKPKPRRGAARHRGHGKRGEGLHPPRRHADVAEGWRDIGLGSGPRAALRPAVAAGPADATARRRVFSAVGHHRRARGVPLRVAAAGAHAMRFAVRRRTPRVPRADQPVDGIVQGVARAFPGDAVAAARDTNRASAGSLRRARRGSQRRVRPVPGRRVSDQPVVGGHGREHRRGEGGERFGKDFRRARARRGGE